MPTWSEILLEITRGLQTEGPLIFDNLRRRYLKSLHDLTGRNVILYASKWTQALNLPPEAITIFEEDVQAFMEVMYGLQGPKLDLIIHSPGGSPEVAEMLVIYLREKFTDIRVIVPQGAMSAATMIACAADRVVMGRHSFLGPIDPQLILNTPLGQRWVPADEIIQQFDEAVEVTKENPQLLGAFIPMLAQYGPDLIVKSRMVSDLAKKLVAAWLELYMFRADDDRQAKAKTLSDWLAAHSEHKTHGRHIVRKDLRAHGMVVDNLEDEQQFQDIILSIFHATTHVFAATPTVKIVENHLGKAYVKQVVTQQQLVMQPSG